jgi:uncharacterized protein (DUF302 family)
VADCTTFTAVWVTCDSAHNYATTRHRFDEQVPLLDQMVSRNLVVGNAGWPQVEAEVGRRTGPSGFVALSRLDEGALLSLQGEPVEATQYLVGNPTIAQQVISLNRAACLHAPFPLAIYTDAAGTHIAFSRPSGLFGPLRSQAIDEIASGLDVRILRTVEGVCGLP